MSEYETKEKDQLKPCLGNLRAEEWVAGLWNAPRRLGGRNRLRYRSQRFVVRKAHAKSDKMDLIKNSLMA